MKIRHIKSQSESASDRQKNDYKWDSNPCSKQSETYTGFKVAAVFQRRIGITPRERVDLPFS